jgi:hypothetical protein
MRSTSRSGTASRAGTNGGRAVEREAAMLGTGILDCE